MSIHPETTLGHVRLTIADMARSLSFYQDRLGFKLHRQEGSVAYLGAGGDDLLVLEERPDSRPVRGTTGLYHYAILVPDRVRLAASLRRIIETQTPVQGFSDHHVSEAIYLPDPDGNGIEIYRDRPRDEWEYNAGRIKMGTDPLDLQSILDEIDDENWEWEGLAPGTILGHMHLHVGHIQQAEAFWLDVIGFDLMLRYGPTASFVSAGGYHHHLGFNTWAGVGAPPPPDDAVGLQWFTINLPDKSALDALAGRLDNADVPLHQRDDGTFVRDPFQNGVLLTTQN